MRWEVLHGDCLEVLRGIPENSIDAVVTDPPYGLSFMGKAWDYDVPQVEVWREVLRVLKPGGHLLSFFGTRTQHRGVCAIEDGGFEIRDSLIWMYGSGFPKSLNVGKAIKEAAGALPPRGPLDKLYGLAWEGWGTALKPAHEPIVLARKALIGTVAANVLEHGTGALNIDGCRLSSDGYASGGQNKSVAFGMNGLGDKQPRCAGSQGRWPSNVCLDEEAARLLDEQSGTLKSGSRNLMGVEKITGVTGFGGSDSRDYAASEGGASRFFYTAKAPREERDAGLELLDVSSGGEATGRKDGSAGLNSPRAGAGRNGGARNTHPTVKPVDLMRWLVRLVTPPGGVVLDPFAGSASTGVACLHEGFRFIGIEREAEYFRMAKERLSAWAEVKASLTTIKARAAGQMPLFAKATP